MLAPNKGEGAGSSPKSASTDPVSAEENERGYLMDANAFDNLDAAEYGGQSDVMDLKVGEVAGPLSYTGFSTITTDLGDATSHTAIHTDTKESIRLPLAASFNKALDQASVNVGDIFAIKRNPDVMKKKGKGANRPMAIYSLKIIKRIG